MSIEVIICNVCDSSESCNDCGDRQVCEKWFETIGLNCDEPFPYLY